MPRHVDHEDRRRQIVAATLDVLAEQGASGLSFRTVASRMGGSSTLVTHYFRTRQELIDALVEFTTTSWSDEVADLDAGTEDPRERLRLFLRWMLPTDEEALKEEIARINLLGDRDARLRTQHVFAAWDEKVRELMARHLEGIVDPERVPAVVDLLRSLTNGIALSVVEHPGDWPTERQHAVLDELLVTLDLMPATVGSAT
jgi:AcrR family transcriptional regulator